MQFVSQWSSFNNSISELSLKVKGRRFFKDHQDYTDSVVKELSKQITANSINHIVTTEKDFVKLPERFLAEFEVYIIKIDIVFENELVLQNIMQPLLLN